MAPANVGAGTYNALTGLAGPHEPLQRQPRACHLLLCAQPSDPGRWAGDLRDGANALATTPDALPCTSCVVTEVHLALVRLAHRLSVSTSNADHAREVAAVGADQQRGADDIAQQAAAQGLG